MASGQVAAAVVAAKHGPSSLLTSALSLSASPANSTQQASVIEKQITPACSASSSIQQQLSRSSSSNSSHSSITTTATTSYQSVNSHQNLTGNQARSSALIWPICSPSSSSRNSVSAAKIPITRDGVHQSIRLHRKSLQEERLQQTKSQLDVSSNKVASSSQYQRASRLTPVSVSRAQLVNEQRATSIAPTAPTIATTTASSLARSNRQKVTSQPTPASTNCRVRQGMLFARRQYHISPQISAVAITTTTPSQQPTKVLLNTRRTSSSSAAAATSTTSHAPSSTTNKSPLSSTRPAESSIIRDNRNSNKSLALAQQQQRRKLFNRHQISTSTSIPKSSSKFSLTSSTSSLTLNIVKRVKPSPQVTSSTSTRIGETKFSNTTTRRLVSDSIYRSTRSLNSTNLSSKLLGSRRIVASRASSTGATSSSSSSASSSPSSTTSTTSTTTRSGISPSLIRNRLSATRATSSVITHKSGNGSLETGRGNSNVTKTNQLSQPTVAVVASTAEAATPRKPTTATRTESSVAASVVSFNQPLQQHQKSDVNKLLFHQSKQNFLASNRPNNNYNIPIPTIPTNCINNLHLTVASNNNITNINNNSLLYLVAYDQCKTDNNNQNQELSNTSSIKTTSKQTPFIDHSQSGDDQMVIGSPLVTPPPSESDTDIENDNHQSLLNNNVVSNSENNVVSSTTPFKVADLNQQVKSLDIPIRLEPICDYYDLEARPFARGKFAQVKRCINKISNHCFAAKCIKKRRRLVDIRHEILLEIEALKLSYYTNRIVKLYEVFETSTEMILVLEMANGGELQRVLDDEEVIEEKLVQRMVQQILEGLEKIHDNDIAHLDIKPQNLLLTESFPNGDIKLCDFGISRRITKDCEIREICGTPDYVAPEILRYDPITLATDMWSLGVLTYVLLSGYSPFGSDNKQQTFCNITQATLDFPTEIFDKISKDAIDFMQKLIVKEPSERLTSRQARNHPWLAKSQ